MVYRDTSARPSISQGLGLVLCLALCVLGSIWAFKRGGHDFNVFFEAWRLVWNDKSHDIYRATPDRFLYAPGFAWIFSPLAALPVKVALGVWCFLKAALLFLTLRFLHQLFQGTASDSAIRAGVLWSIVFLARPVLIDFQYGQVNLPILFTCVWALATLLRDEKGNAIVLVSWTILAISAWTKLMPLPLLLLPWVSRGSEKLKYARIGSISGSILILVLPFVFEGVDGAHFYSQWRQALIDRGLPMESHNQSFAAVLHHYLSGQLTHIISQGSQWVPLGGKLLEPKTLQFLILSWSFAWLGVLVGWILGGPIHKKAQWSVLMIALLIIPSHLVWKPYFIFGIPLAAFVLMSFFAESRFQFNKVTFGLLVLIFSMINLSGFDFVGNYWAGRLEAASIFLIAHLMMYHWVLSRTHKL